MITYVAAPFNDPDENVMKSRMKISTNYMAKLLSEGKHVVSPLLLEPLLYLEYKMPTEYLFWKRYCDDLINVSDELIVICLPGWTKSQGVTAEIARAIERQIPIQFVEV